MSVRMGRDKMTNDMKGTDRECVGGGSVDT